MFRIRFQLSINFKYTWKIYTAMDTDSRKDKIEYSFHDSSLINQAFTTKSYAKEMNEKGTPCESQQSLCTLGDAILKKIIIELLIEQGYATPKDITEIKKDLESHKRLAMLFENLDLNFEYVRKGTGERKSTRLFAETMEAIIAAMYLDIKKHNQTVSANEEVKKYIAYWYESDFESLKKNTL